MKTWMKRGIAIFIAVLLCLGVLVPVLNVFAAETGTTAVVTPVTGDNFPIWLLFLFGGALIIIILCIVLSKKKNKKDSGNLPSEK